MRQLESNHRLSPVITPSSLDRASAANRGGRSAPADSILKECWHILLAHKFVFLLVFVLCSGLALGITLLLPPVFQAKASLELQTSTPNALGMRDGDSVPSGMVPTFDSYLETQIGILESQTLVQRVVNRIGYQQRLNTYNEARAASSPSLLRWATAKKPLTAEQTTTTAMKNLKVRQSRMNNLIEIYFESTDPKAAADFVNALTEEYTQQSLESRWEMARRAEGYLTHQLNDLRVKLEDSEKALQQYSEGTGILLVGENRGSVAEDRLHELQQALSQAQGDRFLKQSQVEMAQGKSADSVPQVLENPSFREYQAKAADLRRQIADLNQVYTPSNPKVARVQAQLDELEKSLTRQRSDLLTRLKNEFEAAERREKMLAKAYDSQTGIVSTQAEKMVRYNTLKHEVDSNRSLYETLLQRVKQSSVTSALQATNVRVVDPAVVPIKKFKPSRTINTALGALAGLILGLFSVFVREHSGPRLRRPGIAGRYIQAPELGVVPVAAAKWNFSAVMQGRPMDDPSRMLTAASGSDQKSLKAWLDPASRVAESFRVVMTSLLFSEDGQGKRRVLLVSSPGPGEGKTTVTLNLGAALAETGRRVLLVDGDLRCPTLYEAFGLNRGPGLVDLLRDPQRVAGPDNTDLEGMIQETEVPGLFVLAPGSLDRGNLGIFYSESLSRTVQKLRLMFDIVLIDSPPILAVPEARALARVSDGVILVLRAGVTEVDSAMEAERRIRMDGSRLLGTVLNQASPDTERYYPQYARSLSRATAVS